MPRGFWRHDVGDLPAGRRGATLQPNVLAQLFQFHRPEPVLFLHEAQCLAQNINGRRVKTGSDFLPDKLFELMRQIDVNRHDPRGSVSRRFQAPREGISKDQQRLTSETRAPIMGAWRESNGGGGDRPACATPVPRHYHRHRNLKRTGICNPLTGFRGTSPIFPPIFPFPVFPPREMTRI